MCQLLGLDGNQISQKMRLTPSSLFISACAREPYLYGPRGNKIIYL